MTDVRSDGLSWANVERLAGESASSTGSPAPTYTTTTPSGIEICFFEQDKEKKVKRHYEIKPTQTENEVKIFGPAEWRTVPSVTDVLDILWKGGLIWWAQEVGVSGLLELFDRGIVRASKLPGGETRLVVPAMRAKPGEGLTEREVGLVVAGPEEIVQLLQQFELSTTDVRDRAGERGQSAHKALEWWAKTGELPDPGLYPEQEQGYVTGLRKFLVDTNPEPLGSETMVASLQWGYAGRPDIRLKFSGRPQVVRHHTPARGNQYEQLNNGVHLADLKTSKDVYDTHCEQLEAYEKAGVECGYEPTDERRVLQVSADGKYKYVKSWAVFEDFLTTLMKYKQNQDQHLRWKERNK